jgi:hypothetical protein
VVTAPSEAIPQIRELVSQLDMPTEAITTLRVFPLQFADATQVANVIASLYPDSTSATQSARFGDRRGFFGRRGLTPPQQQTATQSERKVTEAKVVPVADTRTNSVIVSASPATMADIEKVIEQLDATRANVPDVHVYKLDNADVSRVKEILDSMFDELEGSGTTSRNTTSGRTTPTRTTGTGGFTGGRTGAAGGTTRR